ncbi:hypothetical protein RJT34_16366 [Clitoria ternatea]|uniref:Uncharacterized protein n=1 Tax=Clitoria ternatea TaxID=43366 RepID=A0AAN9JA32_CLITE
MYFLNHLLHQPKMEVEIMSTQYIKPSSPMLTHPKTHSLSILDQFFPPIYIPMVFFYPPDQSTESTLHNGFIQQKLKLLKESLSQVLNQFYPFAGRIKDNLSINCNDEGVHYTEAKVSYSLIEFFNQPNFSSCIHKFLPNQPILEASPEGYTTMIQVTCFACGAIVIGTFISHMIADGAAASYFLNTWGSTTRGEFQHAFEFPKFDTPFPRNIACPQDSNATAFCGQFLKKGKLATTRLLFDKEAISKLRVHGASLIVQNPTRVEVVISLLCKCIAKAFKANTGLEGPTLVTHAVNMRPRASPNFPKSYMGNFVWMATALMSSKGNAIDEVLPELVIKLRKVVTAIDSDFVKGFEDEGGFVKYSEVSKRFYETGSSVALTSGVNNVHFVSWCNFGLYDVDYGWGKPIWVSCTPNSSNSEFFNSVILTDTPLGNGIEAWVYLNDDDMTMFQQDKELLSFASLEPSPLQLKDH